jgi:hypothetical protein
MTVELHWFFVRFGLPVLGFGALAFMAGAARRAGIYAQVTRAIIDKCVELVTGGKK